MSSRTAFVTIVTRNYYTWARVWADSVRRFHPQADIFVAIADTPEPGHLERLSGYRILTVAEMAADLRIGDYRRMAFQYTPFELTCALKPFVVQYLHRTNDRVIYLDADTRVYRELQDVQVCLERDEIVVTPHLTGPLTAEQEMKIRSAGSINGGFLATRTGEESDRFLSWWAERCRKHCYVDPYGGRFVDQSWLDLATSIFQSVRIEKNPALNVAYWNLDQRILDWRNGSWTVDEQPLGFFHFSGFDPQRPNFLSRFDTRVLTRELLHLCSGYSEALHAVRHEKLDRIGCQFAQYDDGREIDPLHREAIRLDLPVFSGLDDPFAVSAEEFQERFEQVRDQVILSRKHWQLVELQEIADRQAEWIRERIGSRIDRRVLGSIGQLYRLITGSLFGTRGGTDEVSKAA